MSETTGSAPQSAEVQEKVKTPERELISSERVGLTARLCLSGEALNPDKTDLQDITSIEQVNNLIPSLKKVNKLSKTERTEHWEKQNEKNFDKQKELWAEQVNATLLKKLSQGTETDKKAWKELYGKWGIQDPSKENLLAFYDTYFTGANQLRSLEAFVADTLVAYKPQENSPTDLKALNQDLDKIAWFANIFGENSSKIIPSVLQAAMLSNDPAREEFLKKANAKENGTSRINRLTAEEKSLLEKLFKVEIETTVPPTPRETEKAPVKSIDETEPKERGAAAVIPKEQLDALKSRKVKVGDEEITYADLVGRIVDVQTGKVKDNLPKLDAEYAALQQEIGKMDTSVKEALDKGPHVIISPLAWAMMDAIAQRSDTEKKMLGFNLLLAPFNKDKKDQQIAVTAAPAHDFTKAEEKRAELSDLDLMKSNNNQLSEQSGLKNPKTITIHTHHASLGEKFTATPSPKDYAEADMQLETQNNYSWGVLTKTPDGSLSLAVFSSFKTKENKKVHKLIGVLSPDMKEVYALQEKKPRQEDRKQAA